MPLVKVNQKLMRNAIFKSSFLKGKRNNSYMTIARYKRVKLLLDKFDVMLGIVV